MGVSPRSFMANHETHHSREGARGGVGAHDVTFTCPMHPGILGREGGRCLECGMELVAQKTARRGAATAKVGTHAGHGTMSLFVKFAVSFLLSVPIVLYSDLPQALFKWDAPSFTGSAYLPALFGSIVFFYGGWVFLAGAFREIRGKLPGMMTLVALAITSAYAYSVSTEIIGKGEALYWELATLITIMLLGHWFEERAVRGAQGALRELSKLIPDTAEILREGEKTETVPVGTLAVGDRVLVRPGSRVPADGEVLEGVSDVNEMIVTGESRPVGKRQGNAVIAGTTNGDGALTVRVAKIGEETFLAGVMRIVAEAQASKSRLQTLADRAARYLTGIAVVTATASFGAWLVLPQEADVGYAFERAVAVLVIACPHALGLAIPLVAAISTALAAHHGFLVRNRLALEMARRIDAVLFDKTGTLTTGSYGVTDVWPMRARDSREVVLFAAAVDARSEHPIARAIVQRAMGDGIALPPVEQFERVSGRGARGIVNGEAVAVGGREMIEEAKQEIPGGVAAMLVTEEKKGKTIVYVLRNGVPAGAIALADMVREESREAVRALKALGARVAMITGDSEGVAAWVSGELGIDEYFAQVQPGDKAEKVKELQRRGLRVAMVGDGVNDAPALTQADIGIAIGAGTNVAIESAGIILVRNDPRDIPQIIRLSRLTYRKMIQNLFWATGYNVVAIPLAAGVLAAQGIVLHPAFAAALMSVSTIIVAFNAIQLRRQTLAEPPSRRKTHQQ